MTDEDKRKAEGFAWDQLIAPDAYADFILADDFSSQGIGNFARRIEVMPGVAGHRFR